MKKLLGASLLALSLAGCATSPRYGDPHTGFYETKAEYNAALEAERDAIVARLAAEAAQRPDETHAEWVLRTKIEARAAADRANETYAEWAARMDAQDADNAMRNAETSHYLYCRHDC